ncbi:hypothetical protein RLW55_16780 [Hyphomicrobium sp. B1]|uniref:hypothetical protein n=1 Tax=Hyphomicrobium sp. B1 TaxID=3075651 RepID=UPI003C2D0DEE
MSIEDHYRFLRRRIEKCGFADCLFVIWAYSQFLQVRGFQFPPNIEKPNKFLAGDRSGYFIHEWELQTLAEEVILHAQRDGADTTKTLREWRILEGVLQRLRGLENELYGENEGADVLLEISRIMHRQFPWQQAQPNTKLVYRYFRIFSDSKVAAVCQRVLGLSIEDLYSLALTAFSHFQTAVALNITTAPPTLDPLLKFAARSVAEIANAINSVHTLDDTYAYRLSPLSLFPLMRVEDGGRVWVICPIPTLLFWRVTAGLYYDLIGDPDFGNALGFSFERYIGDVLAEAITAPNLRISAEAKYGTRRQPRATPDWLIIEGDTAVTFVECKAKRMTVAAKQALGNLAPLEADIAKLADAIRQLYERISEYAQGQFPNLNFVATRKCFPVVVTLEHWYISGRTSEILHAAAVESMTNAGLDLTWLDKAPYSIMSADEFENAAQIINAVGIATCFEGKFSDPQRRTWMFREYLRDGFPEEWRRKRFLFRDQADAMFDRLIDVARLHMPE